MEQEQKDINIKIYQFLAVVSIILAAIVCRDVLWGIYFVLFSIYCRLSILTLK